MEEGNVNQSMCCQRRFKYKSPRVVHFLHLRPFCVSYLYRILYMKFPPWNTAVDYNRVHLFSSFSVNTEGTTAFCSTHLDLMLTDYNWTFTLIPFNINTALKRIFSKDLSDIEGCSTRPCQMRSVLTIMVRSSAGAASQLYNSLTVSIILCSVSIKSIDIGSPAHYKLQMRLMHTRGVPISFKKSVNIILQMGDSWSS